MTDPLIRTAVLDDEAAALLAQYAIEHAKSLGARVGVVVMDASGTVIVSRRQSDSFPSALRFAHGKAYTAANFGRDSHVMAERLGDVSMAVHVAQAEPRLLFGRGGCVIGNERGELVGAIGVSGASADQDLECARVAVERWQK